MKAKIFVILMIVTAMFSQAWAQAGWKWPEENREKAEEKNALYTDFMKQENYRASATNLYWLLINAPDLNSSLYINGVKIYEGLVDLEKDPAKKEVYQDSVLTLYDLRIKYFNDEDKHLNRKAYAAYKYYKDDTKRYKEILDLFQKTYELNGNNIMDNNVVAYMDMVRRYKQSGGDISEDQILQIYEQLSETIAFKKEKSKNDDRLDSFQDTIDKMLAMVVTVDCDFIENNLGQKLKENPSDLKMAKNILKLSLVSKCLDIPSFLIAAEIVYKDQPEFGLGKAIGLKYAEAKDYSQAVKYLTEAASLAEESDKKVDAFESLAKMYYSSGDKNSAKRYAREMLKVDGSSASAYNILGNIYMSSFSDCKRGVNPVHDKAVYIAAYEMYKRAGNSQGMNSAKEQFPTMEEIFTFDMQVGDSYTIDCLGETVTIQKK